ncbi:MAG TPA: LCP family protein [Anaerolineales bacterium]|nr:LCP family protein [Anaerolineales bacterium]
MFLLIVATAFAVFFMAPIRTNIVFMGIDYVPEGSYVARSDTIMLASIVPLKPHVGLLSIPRDLWVVIPDIGENRINTAHFFAEANSAGSGPIKLMETVRANFGVEMDYYVRIKFEGVREIVNAMGGVDIELTEPMAGYPAGVHHLTGNKALAFARHRLGADDFFRMEQGQILLLGILKQSLKPQNWIHLPRIVFTTLRAIDTDLPWWQWLRLGLAILRAGPEGIGHTIIGREMVASYTTDQGANVLLPDWQKINEIVKITFGN